MSERKGFVCEDGNFYEYPKPMVPENASDEALQSWIDASLDVVELGLFSQVYTDYHRHLLDDVYPKMLQDRSWKGRRGVGKNR